MILGLWVWFATEIYSQGFSNSGRTANITYTHTTGCDSILAIIGYDSSMSFDTASTYAVRLNLVPVWDNDSTKLWGQFVTPDTTGEMVIKFAIFEQLAASTTSIELGTWYIDPEFIAISAASDTISHYTWADSVGNIQDRTLTTPADYKADVSALATTSLLQDVVDTINVQIDYIRNIMWYFGAYSNFVQIPFPPSSQSRYRDSIRILDTTLLPADDTIAVLRFWRNTTDTTLSDSVSFEKLL